MTDARSGNLAWMFDHVGVAAADLAASERFYRIVLSALGAPERAVGRADPWTLGC